MIRFSKMRANYYIVISILLGIPVGLVGGVVLADNAQRQNAEIEREKYDDVLPFLMTGSYGMPLKADVSKDIKVKLNLTEQETEHAISAINDLDDISKNINYTILDSKDKSINADISLYSVESITDTNHTLGLTTFSYDTRTGCIEYPITIALDKKCLNYTSENGVNLLSYVVKHEMMHTLGFADLYDTKYYNKSVMWNNVSVDIDDFTDLDRYNIQKMYDNNEITVTKPSNVSFVVNFVKKEKEPELEM